jgi:hypothetical protein
VVTAPLEKHPKPGPRTEDEQPTTAMAPLVEQVTERIAPVDAEPAAAPPARPAPPAPAEPAASEKKGRWSRGGQSTSADLALLRHHGDVRARVIAAVVAPFVIYTAVMILIGSVHVYLIWVWIPLVTAGVLAGSMLDAAHRKYPPPDDR